MKKLSDILFEKIQDELDDANSYLDVYERYAKDYPCIAHDAEENAEDEYKHYLKDYKDAFTAYGIEALDEDDDSSNKALIIKNRDAWIKAGDELKERFDKLEDSEED